MNEILLSAFIAGLAGSGHCLGMCGGLISALSLGQKAARSTLLIGYNLGRIVSYTIIGLLAGALGFYAVSTIKPLLAILYLIAALLLLFTALYLARLGQHIVVLEKAGQQLWRHIQPLARRFLPVDSALRAFGYGLIWGWLPCGLVYSMLGLALTQAEPLASGATMLAFGLGTLPAMLATGAFASQLKVFMNHPVVRMSLALVLGLFCFRMLVMSFRLLAG